MKKKLYLFAVFFFIIDLISKLIIKNFISLNDTIPIMDNFFYLTYLTNTGGAWSLFSGSTVILVFIGLLVLFYIDKKIIPSKLTKLQLISFAMLIGGILGNIFDRIIYQNVIDFLEFRFFGYIFPVFNLADIFITTGAFLIIIEMVRGRLNEDNSRKIN